MLRAPLVNSHEDVMSKVYDELVTGRSSLEILMSLSREERRVVKECEIGWIRSVPVSTAYGVVSPKYVPVEHVVVYGMPEFEVGAKRWRGPWYCDARGARHALLGTDMAAVEVGGDVTRLKKLVLTTRLGTFDILGGGITDISEIGDVEQYDKSLLNKYLILKKLMAKDGDYLRYAIGCMGEMDDWFDWVQPLVKRSVVSPRPPSFSRRDAVACGRIWREWYERHGGEFEFTNEFLFEVEDRGEVWSMGTARASMYWAVKASMKGRHSVCGRYCEDCFWRFAGLVRR
jgi:hypothetical protein